MIIRSKKVNILGAVIGFAKAIILVVLMHIILGAVPAPGNQISEQSAEDGKTGIIYRP
jgi:hypothetical protein